MNELELLVKGDVARAKNLEDSAKEASLSKEDKDVTEATSGDKSSPEKDKKTWTSIQLKEVLSIFSKIMKKRQSKCARCDMKRPTISSPIFGWLVKVYTIYQFSVSILYIYLIVFDICLFPCF